MSGPKKRKVDSECRVFNKEWTTKYFFTEVRSKAVCLICHETVAILKEYNISHHFSIKHANYANNQSTQERTAATQRLAASLQDQQNNFIQQTTLATYAEVMVESSPKSSDSASCVEDMLARIRSSLKCSFHHLIISSLRASSFPPRPSTIWDRPWYTILSCQRVC